MLSVGVLAELSILMGCEPEFPGRVCRMLIGVFIVRLLARICAPHLSESRWWLAGAFVCGASKLGSLCLATLTAHVQVVGLGRLIPRGIRLASRLLRARAARFPCEGPSMHASFRRSFFRDFRLRYSLAGQDTRPLPEQPGFESRWQNVCLFWDSWL